MIELLKELYSEIIDVILNYFNKRYLWYIENTPLDCTPIFFTIETTFTVAISMYIIKLLSSLILYITSSSLISSFLIFLVSFLIVYKVSGDDL